MRSIGLTGLKITEKIMYRLLCVLSMLLVAAGCTTTPNYNDPLTQYSPDYGYRFENLKPGDNSDSLFVILTFSGGGTRASALSLGILEKLADIEIEWEGRRTRLLDEVDLISSVSGGSFAAAYYAAYKEKIFTDYTEMLYQKNQSKLIRAAFSLPNMIKQASPAYSRTNTAANRYEDDMFPGMTFGDLLKNGERPFIVINATDMGIRRQFSFTQETFDLLYSDLSSYPLGYAVAASSAFPGAFSALILKNHEQGPDFELDPFYTDKIEHDALGSFSRDAAVDAKSYLDPDKIFVHLSDGGVSDNLGLLPVLANLVNPDHPLGLIPVIPGGKEQKIVIIAVNAGVHQKDTLSYKGKPPGFLKLLGEAGTTPMGWFTRAQLGYLQLMIEFNKLTQVDGDATLAPHGTNAARISRSEAPRTYYFIEVGFDKITDDEQRAFFDSIPTKFTLPAESIDRLRSIGGDILDQDPIFQELLNEIAAK